MPNKSIKKSVILTSFGKRLQASRLSKGITLIQFSRATGIYLGTLRKYEAGKIEPKLATIVVMAKALGITHHELLNINIDDLQ
jgi:transcriptional regulator with XRE-family HTH domain